MARRRIFAAALATTVSLAAAHLAACGAPGAGAAAAPQGQNIGGTFTLSSVNSGLLLDIGGGSQQDGAAAVQAPRSGKSSQTWSFIDAGQNDGSYRVVNGGSGKALEVAGGSRSRGAPIDQLGYGGGAPQRWWVNVLGDGSVDLVNVGSGLCLDVGGASQAWGAPLIQWDCSGNANQRWQRAAAGAAAAATQLPWLDVAAAGNAAFQIHDYGQALAPNKQWVSAACDQVGASPQQKGVIVAIAMQETNTMDVNNRDRSKDGTPAANVSVFNMNVDMINQLGYAGGDNGAALNNPANLPQAVQLLLNGFNNWGIKRTLDFHRGGRTAFDDGHSYGAYDYRNAIATIYAQIAANTGLLTDGRRVEVVVDWVF